MMKIKKNITRALDAKPEYFMEYRQRRLAGKPDTLNFHKTNYKVALSKLFVYLYSY